MFEPITPLQCFEKGFRSTIRSKLGQLSVSLLCPCRKFRGWRPEWTAMKKPVKRLCNCAWGIDDLRGPVICDQLQGEKAIGNCQCVIHFFFPPENGMIPLLMISFSNTGVKAIPLISNIHQIWPCAILLRWDELLHNLGPNGPVSVYQRFESIVGCSFPKFYRCSSTYINTDLHFFSNLHHTHSSRAFGNSSLHIVSISQPPSTNDILPPAHTIMSNKPKESSDKPKGTSSTTIQGSATENAPTFF